MIIKRRAEIVKARVNKRQTSKKRKVGEEMKTKENITQTKEALLGRGRAEKKSEPVKES